VVVYRLVPESTNSATVSVSDNVVAVPAGASKTVTTQVSGLAAGQTYNVDVFSSDGSLVQRVGFTAPSVGASSPVIVLTIILAIIFIVLLVVLIVLIGKKPEKSEEFGESYY
jgi:preprotein translocase subunit SecG